MDKEIVVELLKMKSFGRMLLRNPERMKSSGIQEHMAVLTLVRE